MEGATDFAGKSSNGRAGAEGASKPRRLAVAGHQQPAKQHGEDRGDKGGQGHRQQEFHQGKALAGADGTGRVHPGIGCRGR